MSKKKKTIRVVPYDPTWQSVFERESALIRQALGENCVTVDHVGSTSVPGLPAKPKVDILAVVKNGTLSIHSLATKDFAYRGEYNLPFQFLFTKRGKHAINLHVFEEGHPEIELNLVFRDHLRTNPRARDEYTRLKYRLIEEESSHEKNDTMFVGYTLGKNEFIRTILKQENYTRLRFLKVAHHAEWQAYHRISHTQCSDSIGVVDCLLSQDVSSSNAHHLMLCLGCEPAAIACVNFLNDTDSALNLIATEVHLDPEHYGKEMILLIEKWLKTHHKTLLKIKARPSADSFYRALGYMPMSCHDSPGTDMILFGKLLS